jgi:hypothetical protein
MGKSNGDDSGESGPRLLFVAQAAGRSTLESGRPVGGFAHGDTGEILADPGGFRARAASGAVGGRWCIGRLPGGAGPRDLVLPPSVQLSPVLRLQRLPGLRGRGDVRPGCRECVDRPSGQRAGMARGLRAVSGERPLSVGKDRPERTLAVARNPSFQPPAKSGMPGPWTTSGVCSMSP